MHGPGAEYLSYLEDWVERGKSPNRLMAYHLKCGGMRPMLFPPPEREVEFSRPIYPYPQTAIHKVGDPESAANFEPAGAEDESRLQ
jgi:hypothetical protein